MRNKKHSFIYSLSFAIATASMLFTANASAELSGRSVKIGLMVPLTGKGAEWGEAAKMGSEIAAEEINATGGIGGVPVKLVTYDTHTKESEGINLINKLATRDNVLAVSGPCFSSLVEVIFPMLERLKVPVISMCSAKPGLGELSDWGYRNSLTSDKQLGPVVDAWVSEYGVKKVVIIHDLEDAVSKAEGSKVLPALFGKHNVEVMDIMTYRTTDTDFSAQITKAKSMNPDGIGLGSCYQQAAGIVKEARKQGLDVPFLGGACAGSPGYIELGGDATEGTYMSTAAWVDDPRERVQAFKVKMLEKNGGQAFPYSASRSYDNLYILKQIMEQSGVTNDKGDIEADREKIKNGLGALRDYDGVSGSTGFNEVGDAAGGIRVLKVVDGKYIDVSEQ
ncbi:MAG: ABC transporter substrate-binding protein [Gammaproteobacteria bacterium]|nr:ABC transporter substrate-binding protein [Gammaproteobacteria bacterium]